MGKTDIPFIYDDAGNFNNGLGFVKLNNECGYIKQSGTVAILLKYESAGPFIMDSPALN